MSRLVRTQKVLGLLDSSADCLAFSQDGDLGAATSVILNRTDWADMGGPNQITVTIEPGDRLNEVDGR